MAAKTTILRENGTDDIIYPVTKVGAVYTDDGTTPIGDWVDDINDAVDNAQSKTGDTKDNVITYTSGDSTTPTGWSNVTALTTGETHSSLFNKISTMFKNIRYIWNLLGTTTLGTTATTITGAIAEHETDLAGKQAKINVVTLFDNVNYTTQAANAWERIGVSFTVPSNHRYLVQLASGYSQGKPIGLGLTASTTSTRPNFLIQADEVQRYTLIIGAGTWYVMAMRAGTGTNRYDGVALDITLV